MKAVKILIFSFLNLTSFANLKVITTTSNLADVVRVIGKDRVNITSLCKGTQDPHFLEAKPSYTLKLSRADLLVSVGAGLEEAWLPLVIRGSRNPSVREGQKNHLVASDHVDLLESTTGEVSRRDGDVHPEGNPHFLLGPSRAIKVAKAVKDKLIELDEQNTKFYEKNYLDFSVSISNLKKIWSKKVPRGLKVISYHKTLTYFYDEFGIKNIEVLEPKPGISPSASHILKVIKTIKAEKIKKIIVENYFDETVAKRVQKEVPGVEVKVVPVAVAGAPKVNSLVDLYEKLINEIGE